MKHLLSLSMVGVLSMGGLSSGCASLGDKDKTVKGAAIGTVAGAALGAAVGAARGDWKKGAMIGAASGAVVGGVTGAVMDKQEEDLRKAGIRAERDEAGNLLINLSGESLKFDTGKSTLQPAGEALLTRLANVLRQYPENRIVIEGHTDNVGSASNNRILSQARADSVRSFLLKQGVPARCILSATGKGQDEPIADNKTEAGRAQNRRVELSIQVDEEEAKRNQAEREKLKK